MKKIIFFNLCFILCVSMSCKKNHTCECKDKELQFNDISLKEAKKVCESVRDGYGNVDGSCKIKGIF